MGFHEYLGTSEAGCLSHDEFVSEKLVRDKKPQCNQDMDIVKTSAEAGDDESPDDHPLHKLRAGLGIVPGRPEDSRLGDQTRCQAIPTSIYKTCTYTNTRGPE